MATPGTPSAAGYPGPLGVHEEPFVSTGVLPPSGEVAELVQAAHQRFSSLRSGQTAQVYPALAVANPELFGISLVTATGAVHTAGDADVPFTLMSVAKPFVYALVSDTLGHQEARARVGVNATGMAFNSAGAIERAADGRTNPMVNAGAIQTASFTPGDGEQKWAAILGTLSAFAGRRLALDEEMLASARATNHTNRALTWMLHQRGMLGCAPELALDLHTRQSCVRATARDLAMMGATLADGGVNPATGQRAVSGLAAHHALATMLIAGLYETSGDWLTDVGHPGKSGISGAIVTVAPGKGALGLFSPLLDDAGNSVRGQAAAGFLAWELGLDLLHSVRVQKPEDAGA